MNNKRNALGKGLSALLENSETDITTSRKLTSDSSVIGSVSDIPVEQIIANPFQPRDEFDEQELQNLAASIREIGIIQPITVRKMGYDQYQIISGERRFRASKLAGLKMIPAYVRIANDQNMLEMALVENIQRKDLNAVEVAFSYKRLIDECDLTQEELGQRVGKNRSSITNYLRLLRLPPQIQSALKEEKITMGHARALTAVEDLGMQLEIFKDMLANEMSVREVEDIVRKVSKNKKKGSAKSAKGMNPFFAEMQNKLSDKYDRKVNLKMNRSGKGSVELAFHSEDDLQALLELLLDE